MSAPFDVAFDPARNRLSWTMRGFWTLADVAAFAAAFRTATAALGAPPHDFEGFGDATDFPVQSQEVGAALGQLNAAARAAGSGATAIVVGSMMNKLQAERELGGPGVGVFRTRAEAETWLAEQRREDR